MAAGAVRAVDGAVNRLRAIASDRLLATDCLWPRPLPATDAAGSAERACDRAPPGLAPGAACDRTAPHRQHSACSTAGRMMPCARRARCLQARLAA